MDKLDEKVKEMVKTLVEQQMKTLKQNLVEENQPDRDSKLRVTSVRNVPVPSVLSLEGNMKENIHHFQRMFNNYAVSSGLNKEEMNVQVSVMMTIIGDEASKMIYKLIEDPEKQTVENIIKSLEQKLCQEVNVRYERYIFNCIKQEDNENYREYFMKLKSKVKLCEYKQMEEELLLDKITCSIKDINMREKLWLKKNMNLNDAMQMCIGSEEMKQQISCMQDVTNNINKVYTKNNKKYVKQENKKCNFCGNNWHSDLKMCPAKEKECNYCHKTGHFASVCRKKLSVKQIEYYENGKESDQDEILKIENTSKNGVFTTLQVINDQSQVCDVKCQLDTGASCNIIGEKNLLKIINKTKVLLKPCYTILRAFGGTQIKPRGIYALKIRRLNKIFCLDFIVVEYEHCPLLSAQACDELKLISYCNKVKEQESKPLDSNIPMSTANIMKKYSHVFEGLGKIKGEVDLELTNEVVPVRQAPRRIPVALKDELRKELDDMVQQGIIIEEEGYTDWISNLTMVKKNGKLRICLDPSNLNTALKDTKQQLPTLDEILPELNNAKVFSTMDAKKGFWMIQLSEKSSKMTAFWTPFAKYRYLRLPFGISTAMEIFQKKMLEITNGLRGIHVLADDILIVGYGNTHQEAQKDHDKNLENLFVKLDKANVKLNKEKTKLCKNEIKFYGHILTENGVKPDESKVSAILNMPKPTCKEDLFRFLGMVTYLSRYIKNLSDISETLRKITHQDEMFVWKNEQEECFKNIKKNIANATLLKYYDPIKPVTIQTDSSSFAMGCALIQDNVPVAYASKTLTETQRNYAQIEKEMLAIVFACNRFDQYICGRSNVTIETDHSPLVSIFKKPLLKSPKRLQNMILSLQRYNIIVKYKSGKTMYLADTLSRAPESMSNQEKQIDIYEINTVMFDQVHVLDELNTGIYYTDDRSVKISDQSIEKIIAETMKDGQLKKLKEQILRGWPENKNQVSEDLKCYWNFRMDLVIENGVVLKNNQILIPISLRQEFLKKIHSGHLGIEATKKLAKEAVFWPNMLSEIEDTVKGCETCAKFGENQKRLEMMSHDVAKYPFEKISMDVFEINIKGKQRKFLVTVDHYSDFFEIDEIHDLTPKTTVLMCKRNFSRYGIPEKVITDNATNFTGSEFKMFSKEWEFEHITSSPYYPQSNGKAEASVKIIKKMIKKSIEENEDFYKMLLVFRNTPNKTNMSPAKRMMCRWLRCQIPNWNKYQEMINSKECEEKINENRNRIAKVYNRSCVKRRNLQEGEQVWYKKKIEDEKWERGKVISCEGKRSYQVEDEDGAVYRRNEKFIKPNICITESNETEEESRSDIQEKDEPEIRRSTRKKQQPSRYGDFVMH